MYKTIRQEIYVTFVKNPGWQKAVNSWIKASEIKCSLQGLQLWIF